MPHYFLLQIISLFGVVFTYMIIYTDAFIKIIYTDFLNISVITNNL